MTPDRKLKSAARAALAALCLIGLAACLGGGGDGPETSAKRSAVLNIRPGERPPANSEEAGLWMQMDRVERSLRHSRRIVTERRLNRYVKGISCKLLPAYCKDIRIYIVNTPHFNASMAPNGTMQIWTGLLLRCENEAQLAYVIGHEMGHYLRRHAVQRWQEVKSKSNATLFFKVLGAAAGMGFVGDIADLIAMSSVYAFSRDQEREADRIGYNLMVKAGYDPRQAARSWRALMAERDAEGGEDEMIFFASHPKMDERVEALEKRAAKARRRGKANEKQYDKMTLRHRSDWLRQNLRLRKYQRSEVLLGRLVKDGDRVGELHFFRGELYRLRRDKGDKQRAVTAYRRALKSGRAPSETHRSLGEVYWSLGKKGSARASFRRYLKANPRAEDRAIIKSYIAELS